MGVKGCAIHLSFSSGNGVLNAYKPPKSTRTQGGDPIADYIRADTRLPAYLPYPRFLLKMEISQTAKLLYSLLLDRSTLSQKNKWLDDEGRIYIIYPIAEIAEILDKGSTTIKGALNELDMAGLLERERGGFSAPNRLYVKVPRVPQVQFSDQLMAGNPTLIEPENQQRDGLLTLFEALTDAMESDACYYADATFGTKTYPLVLSSALHYAEKILDDTEVCGIYYRELTRESGQVKNARQYDISTLFTLDGIVDMAADAELTDKKAFIKLMLHPDREV